MAADLAISRERWPWLDGLRGIAIIAMAIYHLTWDLTFFHLVERGVLQTPGFTLFGHSIACAFLGIAGFSLALASQPHFDVRKFLLRLGMIAAAAFAVTAVTYFIFPQSYVTFGILHCIAAASLISWAYVRMDWWGSGIAGISIFGIGVLTHARFFDAVNGWLGLGQSIPLTNDWRPIFPWAGAMLIGLSVGKLVLAKGWMVNVRGPFTATKSFMALALAGRHSLAIYLIHQPVLFGLVWVAAQFVQPKAIPDITPDTFVRACEARCGAANSPAGYCARACGCITKSTLTHGLWTELTRGKLTPRQQEEYDGIIATCRSAASAPQL